MTPQTDLPLVHLLLDLTDPKQFLQVYELGLGRGTVYVRTDAAPELWQPVCLEVDIPGGDFVLLTGSAVFFGTDGVGLALDRFDDVTRRRLVKAVSASRARAAPREDVSREDIDSPVAVVLPAGAARRHPRVPYSGDLLLEVGEDIMPAAGRDLSLGGLGVIAVCQLETGSKIAVQVELPDGTTAHASATVVWGGLDSQPGLWNLGLAFQKLSTRSALHLSRFVDAALAPA